MLALAGDGLATRPAVGAATSPAPRLQWMARQRVLQQFQRRLCMRLEVVKKHGSSCPRGQATHAATGSRGGSARRAAATLRHHSYLLPCILVWQRGL